MRGFGSEGKLMMGCSCFQRKKHLIQQRCCGNEMVLAGDSSKLWPCKFGVKTDGRSSLMMAGRAGNAEGKEVWTILHRSHLCLPPIAG